MSSALLFTTRSLYARITLVSSLQTSLSHAVSDGLLKNTSLTGIFDLTLLNQELTKAGETTVPTS